MASDMFNSDLVKNKNIPKPKITSRSICGETYYEIEYYNPFDEEIHIGYGSSNKEYVEQWLEEEFVSIPILDVEDAINSNLTAKVEEDVYGEWVKVGGTRLSCTNCNDSMIGFKTNFCPTCGADMRGNYD